MGSSVPRASPPWIRTASTSRLLTQQGAWWFGVQDRELARAIVKAQNDGTAAVVAKYPDRFIGMASMPMQFPDLAAAALEDGVKRLRLQGRRHFRRLGRDQEPVRPRVRCLLVEGPGARRPAVHAPGGQNGANDPHFAGKGALGNTIGNPLETTIFLSRLIYEGTLDKFPG